MTLAALETIIGALYYVFYGLSSLIQQLLLMIGIQLPLVLAGILAAAFFVYAMIKLADGMLALVVIAGVIYLIFVV